MGSLIGIKLFYRVKHLKNVVEKLLKSFLFLFYILSAPRKCIDIMVRLKKPILHFFCLFVEIFW